MNESFSVHWVNWRNSSPGRYLFVGRFGIIWILWFWFYVDFQELSSPLETCQRNPRFWWCRCFSSWNSSSIRDLSQSVGTSRWIFRWTHWTPKNKTRGYLDMLVTCFKLLFVSLFVCLVGWLVGWLGGWLVFLCWKIYIDASLFFSSLQFVCCLY